MDIRKIKKLKPKLTSEQKKKLLVGLKNYKNNNISEYQTSISNMKERNAIAKVFDTKADFDTYTNQRRGIEITQKELQSLTTENKKISEIEATVDGDTIDNNSNDDQDTIRITKSITFTDEIDGANILSDLLIKLQLKSQRPVEVNKYYIKYEISDDFGINNSTIIKKLKEGNQFCWTAFSKYEDPKEEGNLDDSDTDTTDTDTDINKDDDINTSKNDSDKMNLDFSSKPNK